jgi:uncharacterized membrane protein YczE
LVAGCAIWGAGIDLTVKSHLGVAPWEIFQVAVNELSGISLGRVGQLIGLVLVVITFLAAHIKPRWGTLITLFLVGSFVDIWYPYVPEVQPLAGQVLMLLAGIGMIGLATGLYLKANLGAGPRDAAMFDRKKRPIRQNLLGGSHFGCWYADGGAIWCRDDCICFDNRPGCPVLSAFIES